MNSKLKCSVVTVCYNSEKTIIKNIESVNEQSHNNLEHIFIDGFSKDKTISVIENNSKVNNLIISEIDSGIYNAMNKGIIKSTGDIIVFLNSDDWFTEKNSIANVIKRFSSDTEIVYGSIDYFNIKKKIKSWRKFCPGEYYNRAYKSGWHTPHPAFFIRKKSIKKFFDESLNVSSDFDFMMYHQEIMSCKSVYCPQIITTMSTGGRSGNVSGMIIGNINILKSIRKYYGFNFTQTFIFLIKRFFFKFASLR